mgnify:CR=1 FL=1
MASVWKKIFTEQDAALKSINDLTTSANKMIYATGSDTYATADLTAAGRAILDDADAGAQRTTLGLDIGTNVQAYDAGLNSIAGLTTSANKMIYTTGSDTYATTGLTAAGRAILDDASATDQRTTLGLGSGDSPTFTNLTLSGNLTVSGSTTTVQTATLTVEDKNIVLAEPDTAYTTDDDGAGDANAAANGGGITLKSHHGTDEAYMAALTWNSTGALTGWEFRDTADFSGQTDATATTASVAAIIIDSSATGTPETDGTEDVGVGTLLFNTTDDALYIRTA